MTAVPQVRQFSKIKEVVSGWSGIREFLRGGDEGELVPVVIPRDRRRYGWLFLLLLAFAWSASPSSRGHRDRGAGGSICGFLDRARAALVMARSDYRDRAG